MAARRPLAHQVRNALRGDAPLAALRRGRAVGPRDVFDTLAQIYALHMGPLENVGSTAWYQHDPAIASLKLRLEAEWMHRLDRAVSSQDLPKDPCAALRAIAATDLVPPVYDWLAAEASEAELVEFLAIEGGPDAGFDDLVAICQVGLRGIAKVTLGANYWDEMGRGELSAVHTELHHELVGDLRMPRIPSAELPVAALERSALNGLLATNRALQPEMIGALGLIELQAGPRCRRVVTALARVGAPSGAFPFYQEHATIDPVHGRAWVDAAVVPILERDASWGPRIVRGALWRSYVNRKLFDALHRLFAGGRAESADQERAPVPAAP
jgi:hypothetical protein